MKIDWWMVFIVLGLVANTYHWLVFGTSFNAFGTGVLLMAAAERMKSYA